MTARRSFTLLLATFLLLIAGAPSAATALAETRISKSKAILLGGVGKVIVQRDPIRLRFVDRQGRTRLRQVGERPGSPVPLPETEDPEPFSLERDPDNAVYGPFTFEVGRELVARWTSGLWTANTLFRRREGVTHSARRVIAARPEGRGLRLLVSTTDPKRRLRVTIHPDDGVGFRVRVRIDGPGGVISVADSFSASPREGYYGFGGRHGSVNKAGEKLYGDVLQENFGGEATLAGGFTLLPGFVESGTEYSLAELGGPPTLEELPGGYERYLFPNGPNAAYYPQAQFVSDRGYAFLLNGSPFSRWRMGNDRRNAWQVQAASNRLDYTVVLGGSERRSVRGLTGITGRHRIPPRWAQGPTVWRAVQVPPLPGQPPVETAASYRAKIEADLEAIESNDVDLSAYAFEGWALLDDLGYVRSVIRRLDELGVRTILYVRAFVAEDALATQPPGDVEEVTRRGLVATDAEGRPFAYGGNDGGAAYLLDFTNPETVSWWRERLRLLLRLGADGFMQDFGEQVREEMRFHDGSTGRGMHNRYPVIFHRTTRRILDRLPGDRGKRTWFFTRSGFSGRPGSAAWEMGNFPGDETPDWAAGSGLRSLAPDMLNRAVGGAFGYTTDIGGYADFLTGPPDEELFTRWSEWSALTPYFRVHNSATNGTRMPWDFDGKTLSRWKALAELHERATPYMRRLWQRGRETGMPVTRPLWLAEPNAPGASTESQQWMLGNRVLVAPVVEEGAGSRRVSLPPGCWRREFVDGRAGPRFRGPGRVTVTAPLGDLPFFFRCGSEPF